MAAGLQTIEGILDAAGRDLPDEFSLSDLAAFGARADPAVEAAAGAIRTARGTRLRRRAAPGGAPGRGTAGPDPPGSPCRSPVGRARNGYDGTIRAARESNATAPADRLNQRLNALARPQLLILDEIGYFSLDKRSAHFLFQLISRRYQRGSILLTSNKSYTDWGDVFSDTVLAAALLDRLLPQSVTVNSRGSSYRLKDKLKVITAPLPPKEG